MPPPPPQPKPEILPPPPPTVPHPPPGNGEPSLVLISVKKTKVPSESRRSSTVCFILQNLCFTSYNLYTTSYSLCSDSYFRYSTSRVFYLKFYVIFYFFTTDSCYFVHIKFLGNLCKWQIFFHTSPDRPLILTTTYCILFILYLSCVTAQQHCTQQKGIQ